MIIVDTPRPWFRMHDARRGGKPVSGRGWRFGNSAHLLSTLYREEGTRELVAFAVAMIESTSISRNHAGSRPSREIVECIRAKREAYGSKVRW